VGVGVEREPKETYIFRNSKDHDDMMKTPVV
jgi:hypothetical protein